MCGIWYITYNDKEPIEEFSLLLFFSLIFFILLY